MSTPATQAKHAHERSEFTAGPCDGAVQIGTTDDLRAVWQRNGRTFMVVYDAKCRAHIFDVEPGEIARRCEPPIPRESMG